MDYSQHVSTNKTPQTQPIPGRADQVKNSAGGYVFQVDDWQRLDRFLMLGTEGGTYYAKEKSLTVENSRVVIELIKQDGARVVKRVHEVSVLGLAPKNDPSIFVLALACTFGDEATKKLAYSGIGNVCRTGTHLFTFMQAIKSLRKWSRGLRSGVAKYYESRKPEQLAIQLLKYRQRNGWTHADVVRLAHPTFPAGAEGLAYKLFNKEVPAGKKVPAIWEAFEELQALRPTNKADVATALDILNKYRLPWESLPTEFHANKKVWEALIPTMGYNALLRNLSRFAKLGLTTEHGMDDMTRLIVERFINTIALAESRLHPINILNGNLAYALGQSDKGHGSWKPTQRIVDALNDAFYASYKNIEPSGKNFLLALDVSGSMSAPRMAGTALTPRVASTAIALSTMNSEPSTHLMAFSGGFLPLKISKQTRLNDACRMTEGMPFDTTDCSLPMKWAMKNNAPIDVFVVYTDSETYAGNPHPTQALEQYRQKSGRDAKLVVVGMTATGFTIADPKDPRQLDVVGFSLDTPNAISHFARLT